MQFVSRVACEVLPSVFCERRKCTWLCLCVCLCVRERTIGRAHRQHHIQCSVLSNYLSTSSVLHICVCVGVLCYPPCGLMCQYRCLNLPAVTLTLVLFSLCRSVYPSSWQDVAGITTMMVLSPWEMFICLSLCRFCHNNSTARYSDEGFQVQTGCSQRTLWEAVI